MTAQVTDYCGILLMGGNNVHWIVHTRPMIQMNNTKKVRTILMLIIQYNVTTTIYYYFIY